MVYSGAVVAALNTIFSPASLVLLVLGTVLGLVFGALPGLGGAVAIALLIPLTFDMDPLVAFMILTAAQGGSAFGGSISAILINVPGTAPNAATILDGYPLAKQGQANYALGASAMASASGAIVGVAVLLVSIPVMRQILRLFGPPEFFAMAIMGLSIIAVATRGRVLNGLIAGAIGLVLSFIGFNPITGGARFTFGVSYLLDGVPLLPTIIGVFAIGEMINLLSLNRSISSADIEIGGNVWDGVRSVVENAGVFFRSAIIGVAIGMVPAAGGTVANFVSYVQAAQSSGEPEKFGSGDIRGVIASEAANDAKDGGAIIPTIGFGIPGSAAWAVMLGAFILHGITPGPNLMNDHLDVVFVIIFSLVFSNVLTSAIGIALADKIARVTVTPINILAPTIFASALLGAYTVRFDPLDVLVAAIFGVVGYLLIKYDFSRIALVIGLVLGPLAERSFHQALQISRGSYAIFYTRPLTVLLFLVTVVTLVYPLVRARRSD